MFRSAWLTLPLIGCTAGGADDTAGDFAFNDMEVELHDLINAHRESIGLEGLALHDGFSAIARGHSEDMARGRVEFGHDGFEERSADMFDQEAGAVATGENVAWISAGWEDEAEVIVQGWLDSPGHRENIEADFTHGGMGAAQDSDDGWYATQLFAQIQ